MLNFKVSLISSTYNQKNLMKCLLIFWGFFLDTKSTFYTDIARDISTKYTEVALFFNKIQDTEGHGSGKGPMLTVVMMSEISVLSASSPLIGWLAPISPLIGQPETNDRSRDLWCCKVLAPGKHRKIQRLRRISSERSMFHCLNWLRFRKNAEKLSRHLTVKQFRINWPPFIKRMILF